MCDACILEEGLGVFLSRFNKIIGETGLVLFGTFSGGLIGRVGHFCLDFLTCVKMLPDRLIPHGLVMGVVLGELVMAGDGMRSTACLIHLEVLLAFLFWGWVLLRDLPRGGLLFTCRFWHLLTFFGGYSFGIILVSVK